MAGIVSALRRDIEDAVRAHGSGMRVGLPKVTVDASRLAYVLSALERRAAARSGGGEARVNGFHDGVAACREYLVNVLAANHPHAANLYRHAAANLAALPIPHDLAAPQPPPESAKEDR